MRKIRVNFFLCRLNVPFNILQNICFWLFLWKSEVKSSVSSPSISTRSYLAMLRCCRDYQSRKLLVTRDDGEAEVMSNYSSLLLHWSHPLSHNIFCGVLTSQETRLNHAAVSLTTLLLPDLPDICCQSGKPPRNSTFMGLREGFEKKVMEFSIERGRGGGTGKFPLTFSLFLFFCSKCPKKHFGINMFFYWGGTPLGT